MSNGEGRAPLPFAGMEGRFFSLQHFGGMNTKAQRPAIKDEEFSWLENMMPIGDGNLRSTPSSGTALYSASAGTTIIFAASFNIGSSTYHAIFQSDGTAYQVNTATAVVTAISAIPGTFYGGGSLPAIAQWGNSGILITSSVTNGYWAWDGTTLYGAGQPSPAWLNGGTPTTMPSGLSGTCIETFQARVWVGNGSTISFSGPSNGANFSGAVGGGSFTSSDSFLRREFSSIKQSNGFLYPFADSSINVISNVSTAGSPLVTTFNNQNIDPQTGTPWHNSVQAFGRGLVFGNQQGIYALYGGAAEKVSTPLDTIFAYDAAIFAQDSPTQQPSSAVATVFGIRVYLLLIPVNDLFTGQSRNVAASWDGEKWFLVSQDSTLVFIWTQEINSVLTAWGTDGTNVFQLFAQTSITLNKIWQTKLWAGDGFVISKQGMRDYLLARDNSGGGYTITDTIDCVLENKGTMTVSQTWISSTLAIVWLGLGNAVLQFTGLGGANLNFSSPALTLTGQDAKSAIGALMGVTFQSSSADFTINAFALGYRNLAPVGG